MLEEGLQTLQLGFPTATEIASLDHLLPLGTARDWKCVHSSLLFKCGGLAVS